MSQNDYIQYAIVAVILVLAIMWIVRRMKNRNSGSCDCGCSKCSMSDKCDNRSDIDK